MKDRLFSRSFICIVLANFLLYFGFWMLTPVLPFYLTESFNAGTATAGLIISCYTVSALCMRPFSGFLLDSFSRKPLYLVAYFVFLMVFLGYISASVLGLFAVLRVIHGIAFGMVTVGGNTIAIDVMPSSRRGEGLGYYGLSNNFAMAVGPMTGLTLHECGASYQLIFSVGMFFCLVGFLFASFVKTPAKAPVRRPPVSLDRFVLKAGIPAGVALLLLSVPYGMTTNYVAMYAKSAGIMADSGLFFCLMALGMAVSRVISGKFVDKGYICEIIQIGFFGVVSCFLLLSACQYINGLSSLCGSVVFLSIPFVLGVGFGVMFPAYNTLFVNLAPNNQRGTATSTYLTSWDIGLGIGIVLGGRLAESAGFPVAYLSGTAMSVISAFYFRYRVTPHFAQHRLR